jgi:hypothetical protein
MRPASLKEGRMKRAFAFLALPMVAMLTACGPKPDALVGCWIDAGESSLGNTGEAVGFASDGTLRIFPKGFKPITGTWSLSAATVIMDTGQRKRRADFKNGRLIMSDGTVFDRAGEGDAAARRCRRRN